MIAHDRVVNERKDLLIVILREKINVEKLPANLRPYIRESALCNPIDRSIIGFIKVSHFTILQPSFCNISISSVEFRLDEDKSL